MKRQLFYVIALFLLFAPNLFGQTPNISGKYEGTAEVQPFGKLPIKAEIRQKDGKFSGSLNTPLGDAAILEGSLVGDKLTLKIDAGGDDIFLNGKVGADGKINGEVTSATVKGTFEMKRTGDVEPEKDFSPVLRQSKEKWREALRFLAEELPKRHKNAFHRTLTLEREGVFGLVELWVENRLLLELLTPEMASRYLNFMTPQKFADFFGFQLAA